MELRKGYKKTEVGVIPDDWEVRKLIDICSPSKLRINPVTSVINYRCIELEHLSQETGRLIGFANSNELLSQKTLFKPNDVLFGKLRPYLKKFLFADFDGVCTTEIWVLKSNEEIVSKWLFYLIQTNRIIEAANQSTGTKMPRAEWKTVGEIGIPLPPTKAEQTAIADALSDADALISSLEKLIAKKQNIKQGTMYQLLTPREGWEVKTLHGIADNKKELFDDGDWIEAEHITNKGVRLIQTGNIGIGNYIEKENKKYIFEKSFHNLKCKPLIVGDLLICRLAEPAGRACILPDIGESKVVTSVDVTIFRPQKEIANRIFLANLFSTSVWFHAVTERVGGTTHKRISRSALGKIDISVPDINEQNRISQVLGDMDAEIDSLEHKLNKYKMVKQGMMQELLTGKVRLI